MPDYITKAQLEGIMASFQDQFRDFVMHFNKGQGILIQRFESVDHRLDTMAERNNQRFESIEHKFAAVDQRFEDMEQRLEGIEQRFVEVNAKLDYLM